MARIPVPLGKDQNEPGAAASAVAGRPSGPSRPAL